MPEFPADIGLTVRDSSFFDAAVDKLHFENIGTVKAVLYNLTGQSRWQDSDMPGYWQQLWEHQVAPVQETFDGR